MPTLDQIAEKTLEMWKDQHEYPLFKQRTKLNYITYELTFMDTAMDLPLEDFAAQFINFDVTGPLCKHIDGHPREWDFSWFQDEDINKLTTSLRESPRSSVVGVRQRT